MERRNGFIKPVDLLPTRAPSASAMVELPENCRHNDRAADDASPWLNEYIEFSRLWSPRGHADFHESIGLWLLSTVAARRVVGHVGKPRYTPLMIALAARTSKFAKSTTAYIGQDILEKAGLSFLLAPDDATPQAFVRNLTRRLPDNYRDLDPHWQEQAKLKIAFSGQTGWYFDEFGMKISAMMREGGFMSEFRGLLRKFDDTPDVYEYETIGRGKDIIHNPYLALLANLTPDDLKPHAKKRSALWGDGFWARFIFLTPAESDKRVNDRFPPGECVIPSSLYGALERWHHDLGVPRVDVEELESGDNLIVGRLPEQVIELPSSVIDAFYDYGDALLDIISATDQTDLDGNYTRLPEKALRVAMLLASLEDDGHCDMRHWHRAQRVAESWRRNLHNAYAQVVDGEQSAAIATEDRILRYIAESGPATVRELYTNIAGLDSETAKRKVESLEAAGLLAEMKDGRRVAYRLEVEHD